MGPRKPILSETCAEQFRDLLDYHGDIKQVQVVGASDEILDEHCCDEGYLVLMEHTDGYTHRYFVFPDQWISADNQDLGATFNGQEEMEAWMGERR